MAQVFQGAFKNVFFLVTLALLVSTASPAVSAKTTSKPGSSVDTGKTQESTNNVTKTGPAVQKPEAASDNCTKTNDTECSNGPTGSESYFGSFMNKISENRDMLLRTMYVLIGVTSVVILYFVVRAWRLRRKRSKSRKYGVITTRGDLEMEPLGQGDEDDEDYTVFEMNGRKK